MPKAAFFPFRVMTLTGPPERLSASKGHEAFWKAAKVERSGLVPAFVPFIYNIFQPSVIRIAEEVNIIGHNLNGKKLILKPVKRDTTVRIRRQADEDRYTAVAIIF